MAQFGERAVPSFEIGGGQIVEHQRSLGQVLFGQSSLDAGLLRQQPIHGLIEFILGDRIEMEELPQRTAESVGVKSARGGKFGSRSEDTGGDHRQHQITIAVGILVEETVEMQFADGAEDGGDMAVRAGADDVEGLWQRGTDGSGALQDGAQGVDFGWGPVGEIGDGSVADFAVVTEALAQEDGGRGIAVGDDGDVHVYMIGQLARDYKHNSTISMTTLSR